MRTWVPLSSYDKKGLMWLASERVCDQAHHAKREAASAVVVDTAFGFRMVANNTDDNTLPVGD